MAESEYEPSLDTAADAPFSLSEEQRDTARLLAKILGRSISERYLDFCQLAYGSLPLSAPSPLAAHSLRELDSSFRDALESLAGVKKGPTDDELKKIEAGRATLEKLGLSREAFELSPKGNDSYRDAIRKIAEFLDLDPEGALAKSWLKFKDVYRKVHERKFNRPLAVDEDFRETWARPFEAVTRGVAIALEGRYAALMTKVAALAAMPDTHAALDRFEKEIPGGPPLQWHFYMSINGEKWLPEIIKRGLTAEPIIWPSTENEGRLYGEWPVGQYLTRMAEHSDASVRAQLVGVLNGLAPSRCLNSGTSGLRPGPLVRDRMRYLRSARPASPQRHFRSSETKSSRAHLP